MTTLLGLDLGTSTFKISAFRDSGEQLGTIKMATPWSKDASATVMEPSRFSAAVHSLVDDCVSRYGDTQIAAIGVTGMAETIFVESQQGKTLPAVPWNTRSANTHELPDAELFAQTGLIDAARTPAVALRLLSLEGVKVKRWVGLPEYAVEVLGGSPALERSLSARTGLINIVSAGWSAELAEWAGIALSSLPEIVPAGTIGGTATSLGSCAGAILTVAGHDHLVAAIGADASTPTTVFDSLGTGEAIISQIAPSVSEIDLATVRRFNAAGFNVGLGTGLTDTVALAGLGTGNRFNLLLETLSECGYDRKSLLQWDERLAAVALQDPAATRDDVVPLLQALFGRDWQELRTSGAALKTIRSLVRELADARLLWWQAVRYSALTVRHVLTELERLTPQATDLVIAGGWLGNPGIRAIRKHELGSFRTPDIDQCGTRGAALLAGLASGVYASPLEFPLLSRSTGVR